jgi:hypothetical protein
MLSNTLGTLFGNLWNDDGGAVLASEYLTLGSVVVLGGVTGLTSLRDSVNDEMREFGGAIRSVRQSYSVAGQRSGVASTSGASHRAGGSGGGGSAAPRFTVMGCDSDSCP